MFHMQSRGANWRRKLMGLILALLFWLIPGVAVAQTPQSDLAQIDTWVEQSLDQLKAKEIQAARHSYQRFATAWEGIEAGIRSASPKTYYQVEKAMAQVMVGWAQTSPGLEDLTQALADLHQVNQTFISTSSPDPSVAAQTTPTQAPAAPPSPSQISLVSLLDRLDQIEDQVSSGQLEHLPAQIAQLQREWVEMEGSIAAKSSADYDRIETGLSQLRQLSQQAAPNGQQLQAQIESLRQRLRPYRDTSASYGVWDAMVILLREGIEALLVIVALLAFLNKSNHPDQRIWIWTGAGLGILASIATALGIHLFFSRLFTASHQELIEGVTGVLAAFVLVAVSYWLHSRSSAAQWKGYIQSQVSEALQRNGVFSLGFLAFLAIYREGAETVLFYIGIAPSIETADLVLGLGLGFGALVVIAGVIWGLGVRLPLRPFFRVTSLLIYFLGFKFLGNGFHALQVAGILPSHGIDLLPTWDRLGVYSTWETLVAQLSLIALGTWVFFWHRAPQTPAAAESQ